MAEVHGTARADLAVEPTSHGTREVFGTAHATITVEQLGQLVEAFGIGVLGQVKVEPPAVSPQRPLPKDNATDGAIGETPINDRPGARFKRPGARLKTPDNPGKPEKPDRSPQQPPGRNR